MSSQTPRRSTRIASAAPSAAGSAVSIRTTVTNRTSGARARLSQGHLPRLNVQGSSAYGASGNPIVGSNQPVTGDFASFFERERGQAMEREVAAGGNPQNSRPSSPRASEASADVEAPPSPKEMPPPTASTRRRTARASQNGFARTPATRSAARAGEPSYVDSPSKSYGEIRETGITGAPRIPAASRLARQRENLGQQGNPSITDNIKGFFKSLSVPKLWPVLPLLIMLGIFLVTNGYLPHKLARLNPFSRWVETGDDAVTSYFYDNLTPRVDELERRMNMLPQRLQEQWHNDLETFKNSLPPLVAVTYNEAENSYEIPVEVWNAIESKMSRDRGRSGGDMSPGDEKTWDAWLKKNHQYVQAMLDREFDQTLDSKIGSALASKAFVSQDTLLSILDTKYSDINADISATVLRDVRKELSRVNRDAKTVAVSAVQDAFKQLPMRQLEALAQANLVRNAELATKHINFLAPAYSPYILPRFTSQTQTKQQTWLARAYLSLVWIPGPRTPIAALEPWQEPADCWCAAPSSQLGYAQLGIDMAHRVYASSFTIEHYPKAGVIDWTSAPKDVELWAYIADAEQRETVRAARAAIFGVDDDCSPPGKGHRDMVCVGKFAYDVDAPNHVQNFDLDISLKDLRIAVNRVVVRVTSNYGQDWTCIYRVLLHGEKE